MSARLQGRREDYMQTKRKTSRAGEKAAANRTSTYCDWKNEATLFAIPEAKLHARASLVLRATDDESHCSISSSSRTFAAESQH